jgi:metal-sulfur cluster biosynthetic enzyme
MKRFSNWTRRSGRGLSRGQPSAVCTDLQLDAGDPLLGSIRRRSIAVPMPDICHVPALVERRRPSLRCTGNAGRHRQRVCCIHPQGTAGLAVTEVDMVTEERVREALTEVQDPELHMGILELGLVYDVNVEGPEGEDVNVVMTLTSPMCPVGPMFKQSVQSKVESIEGVKNVKVDITFTPPWDPKTMASDDVKVALGIW